MDRHTHLVSLPIKGGISRTQSALPSFVVHKIRFKFSLCLFTFVTCHLSPQWKGGMRARSTCPFPRLMLSSVPRFALDGAAELFGVLCLIPYSQGITVTQWGRCKVVPDH